MHSYKPSRMQRHHNCLKIALLSVYYVTYLLNSKSVTNETHHTFLSIAGMRHAISARLGMVIEDP